MKKFTLMLFTIVVAVFCVAPSQSFADRDWDRGHDRGEHRGQHERSEWQPIRNRDRDVRVDRERAPRRDIRLERRLERHESYPRAGVSIRVLPKQHHQVHFHNRDYFYWGGIWYEPSGLNFIVVTPPLGIVVPILPPSYDTVWWDDTPYYFANGVYYLWRPDLSGYEVVDAPVPEDKQSDVTYMADKLFIYPKKGQSKQQQSDDRYACHRYGVEQTGYDPSQPPSEVSAVKLSKMREDYQRAMKSCLEAKDYSVR